MKRFISTHEDWTDSITTINERKTMMTRLRIEEMLDEALTDCGAEQFNEMDSLSKISLIMELEDEFDVSIPINDVDTMIDRSEFVSKMVVLTGLSGAAT